MIDNVPISWVEINQLTGLSDISMFTAGTAAVVCALLIGVMIGQYSVLMQI